MAANLLTHWLNQWMNEWKKVKEFIQSYEFECLVGSSVDMLCWLCICVSLTTTHGSRETGVGQIVIGFVIEIPKERVVIILAKTVCFSSVMCYALCCDEIDAAPGLCSYE